LRRSPSSKASRPGSSRPRSGGLIPLGVEGPRQHLHQFVERGEIVVVDGGSSDGTPAWLESQRSRLTAFVSEPDRGVYDAMNKGLALAHGEWVLFLGADDRLVNATVLGDAHASLRRTEAEVVAGEIAYDDGRIYRLAARVNPRARNFVHHQGTFYRRALFASNGGFDPSLTVMADYDFNVRLWKTGVRFESLPQRIAACGTHGLSDAGTWRGYAEEIQVRHRHFATWRGLFWDVLSVARYLRKQAIRRLAPRAPSP